MKAIIVINGRTKSPCFKINTTRELSDVELETIGEYFLDDCMDDYRKNGEPFYFIIAEDSLYPNTKSITIKK